MRSVWKFPIPLEDHPTIPMPVGAVPLHVGVQRGEPFLWALVDPQERARRHYQFRLAGTGHGIEDHHFSYDHLTHVGTFQMEGGALVFHLFMFP
jgi:hypothetical protein